MYRHHSFKNHTRPSDAAGFTLVELLVATTLLTIVMTAVYTTVNGTIRAWRVGEANIDTYQSARQILWLISRDLRSIAPESEGHLVGSEHEFTLFTVGQPMDVDDGQAGRVMKVRYHKRKSGFIREESILEGPLHSIERDEKVVRSPKLDLSRAKKFELSDRISAFDVEYIWVPNPEPPQPNSNTPIQLPIPPIITKKHKLGWGLPHSMRIHLTIIDDSVDSGKTTFTTQVAFNTLRTPVPLELLPVRENTP